MENDITKLSAITENTPIIFSDKEMLLNIDKWVKKDINILSVAGISGNWERIII